MTLRNAVKAIGLVAILTLEMNCGGGNYTANNSQAQNQRERTELIKLDTISATENAKYQHIRPLTPEMYATLMKEGKTFWIELSAAKCHWCHIEKDYVEKERPDIRDKFYYLDVNDIFNNYPITPERAGFYGQIANGLGFDPRSISVLPTTIKVTEGKRNYIFRGAGKKLTEMLK